MASENETPEDWSELIQTRISPRALKALDDLSAESMSPSKAATVRKLIYIGLGLMKKEA